MKNTRYQDLKLAERGALISIWAYLILSILKLVIANTTHSESLRADGFNNITDSNFVLSFGFDNKTLYPNMKHKSITQPLRIGGNLYE